MTTDTQLAVQPKRDLVMLGKLTRAKAIYRQMVQIEVGIIKSRDALLGSAWGLGQLLNQLKDAIGHGNWYLWLNANFQELGRAEETRIKNAERCMTLHNRNQNRRNPTDFDPESVRKFMWGYIPVKERVTLDGDRKDAPATHYLTFINNFYKWDRHVEIGQAELPSLEVMRREFERPVKRIKELCGADWVNKL